MNIKPMMLMAASTSLFSVSAAADLAIDEGFGGYIGVVTSYSSSVSNMDPSNENHSGPGNDKSSGSSLGPIGELHYTFGQEHDHQVYAGLAEDDLIEGVSLFQLGYKTELNNGTVVGFAYLPAIGSGEVYSDPYINKKLRTKSKASTHGIRMMAENIFGMPLSLEAAFADTEIDKEQSGLNLSQSQQALLKRDAKSYAVEGSAIFEAAEAIYVEPSLSYLRYDAQGKASAFHKVGVGVNFHTFVENHQISLSMGYAHRNYDAAHPVFSKERSDNSYDATLTYQYEDMLGWDDWSFVGTLGYEKRNSNIAFFNESDKSVGVGMIYQF
ncbi:DUF2860 domain-containing protein [Vibrio sp. Of7-15]|uniref:surface lipoprotein assembly modifier n=1 Tax=Vibrio sp. Of7-15 TaxID=2724879 RepID=UPI001EF32CDD|nr:DUF2860 family protein [Vibrio sp. Of7-15]MCG7499190.1 DUF2860 domain-containing protein [Vibrio sp. Of7-15]